MMVNTNRMVNAVGKLSFFFRFPFFEIGSPMDSAAFASVDICTPPSVRAPEYAFGVLDAQGVESISSMGSAALRPPAWLGLG